MSNNNDICNVLLTHRLPVSRGLKSVSVYLSDYYSSYLQSIENAIECSTNHIYQNEINSILKDKLPTIARLCNDIINVFKLYDSIEMQSLYIHFDKMMEKVSRNLLTIDICPGKSIEEYYRIRSGANSFSHQDMFHIPYSKRHLIRSYRYSIPGYPCLYLSKGIELCWFESGMPKKFSCSLYRYNPNYKGSIKLLNFFENPVHLVTIMQPINEKCENRDETYSRVVNYIITHPIRTACSLSVTNRNDDFIQEYIFPQLLLTWIKKSNIFDGIAYSTASVIENAYEWNYYNLVFPTKEIESDYCRYLSDILWVSEPVQYNISNTIYNHQSDLDRVSEFVKMLEGKYYNNYPLYPYKEILSLCKTFLLLCNTLRSGDYDSEVIYQSIQNINLLSYFFSEHFTSIEKKAFSDEKNNLYGFDVENLKSEFNDVLSEFTNSVRPILREFWYYSSFFNAKNIDRSTCKSILNDIS